MAAAKRISRKHILRVGVSALNLRSGDEDNVVTMTGSGIPKLSRSAKQQLRQSDGLARQSIVQDMLTAEVIGAKLDLSRNTINRMRREDRLVGLSKDKRQYRYPQEQIGPNGLLNGIQDVIRACQEDHWQAWELLQSPVSEIDFESGFAALEKGAIKELLQVKVGRDHGAFS